MLYSHRRVYLHKQKRQVAQSEGETVMECYTGRVIAVGRATHAGQGLSKRWINTLARGLAWGWNLRPVKTPELPRNSDYGAPTGRKGCSGDVEEDKEEERKKRKNRKNNKKEKQGEDKEAAHQWRLRCKGVEIHTSLTVQLRIHQYWLNARTTVLERLYQINDTKIIGSAQSMNGITS